MAMFAFIHGGGDAGWYRHLVEKELRSRGHGHGHDPGARRDARRLVDQRRVVADRLGIVSEEIDASAAR